MDNSSSPVEPLPRLSICDANDAEMLCVLSRRLQAGELTSVDLVERCLTRIDEREPHLRAWVVVDREAALRQAAVCDRLRKSGGLAGPLLGIPVGIKDIIDVAGFSTAAGSRRLASAPAAPDDAPLVANLRRAGAIILGKTVTTQFACFDPPDTRNPWDSDRTPGGSSSGSAAAVASGMCPAALGTQTGGSITRPASYCGIAGLKPTFGRISTKGVFPVSAHLDHPGPMARGVRDLVLLMDGLCGTDEFAAALHRPAGPVRIGRIAAPFDEFVCEELQRYVDRTCELWQQSGAELVSVALPKEFAEVAAHHRRIMSAEAAAVHCGSIAAHPDDYLPAVRSLVEEGLAVSATDYILSRRHQESLKQLMPRCFDGVDALVCAATTGPAPDRSTTGDPACNAPWSYTGLPAASFPIGRAADGLPLAIQLIGPPGGDAALLAVAAWCEDVLRSR